MAPKQIKAPRKAGLCFIVGLRGAAISNEDAAVLKTLNPAGIILGARNFRRNAPYPVWLRSLKTLLFKAQRLSRRKKLLVAIDHEGGRVHRVPPPLTHFPAPAHYAAHAKKVAMAMAKELGSIGVNLYLGPLADINTNPKNPVIGLRAFSSKPEEVAACALVFIKEMLRQRIIPVPKHFPGHGDTCQDSHLKLPRVNTEKKTIYRRELYPFKALIREKVPALMTAHVVYTRLDKKNPATLSPALLGDLLRRKLGFKGLVLSDDLSMRAIKDNYSLKEAVLRAAAAGCDILLFAGNPSNALRAAAYLQRAAAEDRNLCKKLEKSQRRIIALLERCGTERLQLGKLSPSTLKEHRLVGKNA